MALILDLGTGAATALDTQAQFGPGFYLTAMPATVTHLSVRVQFSGGLLPPDIRLALQAQTDDGEDYANVATLRQGNRMASAAAVQPIPYQSFAAADGDHHEFIFVPPLRINRLWRCGAWTASATQTGHRITVHCDAAILAT